MLRGILSMFEGILDSLSIILLTTSLSGLVAYAITRLTYKNAKKDINKAINEKIDQLPALFEQGITFAFNNEKTQKAIVAAGALLASGMKGGFGFQGQTRQKGGIEGLIMNVIGGYIQNKIPFLGGQQQQQGEQQHEQPQW